MINTSDIRNGLTFRYNGEIYTVASFQHVKMGRGGAFYRVKMKSLTTGKVIENSFNSGSKLDDIRVERHKYQYLYQDGEMLVFMNEETYEQINIDAKMIDAMDLLQEGEVVEVLFNTEDDTPLTVDLPQYVIREVTYTEPGLRGDTATNTLKPATLNSGAEVRVPLFINIGDKVKIDTATRAYVERVKE
ncbi:MAG: elongation factor P [Bacteroidetes bacterium]|nr:MAG: elongation factor P [Bacteroidota bacterium]